MRIKRSTLTVRIILRLIEIYKKKLLPFIMICYKLRGPYQARGPIWSNRSIGLRPALLTLFSKIKRVIQKVRLLTKKKKEEFLLLNFISPLCQTNVQNTFAFKTFKSGVARLIRTACKAFHKQGSDEAGVAGYFNSFLIGKGEDKCLLLF